MSLKRNVVANYTGQAWRSLMALIFIPMYIRYMGIEAYGLIAIYAVLQAWLELLDIGMKPALAREMARFTAGVHSAEFIRNVLRTVEAIAIAIASVIALMIWLASPWLASEWVNTQSLADAKVALAFATMGLVTGLRFIESLYASALMGLQRQVLINVVTASTATIRGLGAVLVLAFVSPSIETFFAWQAIISVITVGIFAASTYRSLPPTGRSAHPSLATIARSWRFAGGMMAISFLSLLLTQADKILLSRLLPLQAFAYYAFAAIIAKRLLLLTSPISNAVYPQFTKLVALGNETELRRVYHKSSQWVSVLLGGAAVVLIVFGERILLLWTVDPHLTAQASPILSILALGSLLNGLMWLPYQLQLAHGWTSLTIRANIVAATLLVPGIIWIVPVSGAKGAAWVWVSLNVGYLIVNIQFMHRRLLRADKWRWYAQDVVIPITTATAAAFLCRVIIATDLSRPLELATLLLVSIAVVFAGAAAAPAVRAQLKKLLFRLPSSRTKSGASPIVPQDAGH